jgi:hypothetical protein
MTVTMEQVRKTLDPEEPNYPEAAKLGGEAIPHLETLVRTAEPMLASKAAYLASMILSEGSERVVQAAAESPNPIVRVAAAAAARNLATGATERVLATLNKDHDEGVRKVAARALDEDDDAMPSSKPSRARRGKSAATESSITGEGGGSVDGMSATSTGSGRQSTGPAGEGGGSMGGGTDFGSGRSLSDNGEGGSGGGSFSGSSDPSQGDGGGDHAAHSHGAASSYLPTPDTDIPRLFGGGQF